ncbi:MAG: response regulator transcription factor [Phototrophicales bacterium]|nr:response regulator transcription factor [Phototrophicales bacterium]
MIRIIIVDDYEMVRRGLVLLFSSADDIEVVAVGNNGHDAIALCVAHLPDVLVLDSQMPLLNGLNAIKHIRQLSAHTRIIVLSSLTEELDSEYVLLAGAHVHLVKAITGQAIINIIRETVYMPSR